MLPAVSQRLAHFSTINTRQLSQGPILMSVSKSAARIPMVVKRRGSVGQALASVLESVEDGLYCRGRGRADPLYPKGRGHHMFYVQHQEAGRAAARTVIHKWPKLFAKQVTDPVPQVSFLQSRPPLLDRLITDRRAAKAWHVYLTMKRQGKRVPLDRENALLGLLSYEGLGNPKLIDPVSDEHISWPRGAVESSPTEFSAEDSAIRDHERAGVRGWCSKNIPETMFAMMKTKDGATYDGIISGLVKFRSYGRAFKLFQEMRDCGFQASLGTYNNLLSAISQSHSPYPIAKALIGHMSGPPVVLPDITSINHLLEIASKTSSLAAVRTMREMNHLKLQPTLGTFSNFLKALSQNRSGPDDMATALLQVVEHLERDKSILNLHEETDLTFFLEAFTIARQVRSAELARRLKALSDNTHRFLVDKQGHAMSVYLSTLARYDNNATVLTEYASLVPNVFVPGEWLYRELFDMCARNELPETALSLWKDAQKLFVPLKRIDTLNILCEALSCAIPVETVDLYTTALENVLKYFDKNGISYSNTLITSLLKAHSLAGNLDKAWNYYGLFRTPNFAGLMILLKKHNSLGHKEKTVEVLQEMVQLGMYMPQSFVKEVLQTSGAKESTRREILKRLGANNRQLNGENQQIIDN